MIRLSLALAAALALEACPSTPAAPDAAPTRLLDAAAAPHGDAGPTVFQRACSTLASLACSEGAVQNCASAMQRAQAARLVEFNPECIAAAKTKADARACSSSVRCP